MNTVLPTVMLVDGSLPQCNLLRVSLRAGALYNESGDLLPGLNSLAAQAPDAIILDLGMPDHESWGFVRELSEWFPGPVIVITTPPQEMNNSVGFPAARGQDSLGMSSKSLLAAEYMARKHVLQRIPRPHESSPSIFQIAELRVDLEERLVTLQGREVRLTPSEFRLLSLLIQNVGKVLTHAFLLEAVWGAERTDDIQSLRVYISSLRHKIELNPAEPSYLMTIQGIGYRLRKP